MPKFALLKNGVFVEVREHKRQPENIPHKNVVWLPFRRTDKPVIDHATEVMTGPTITINATEVVESHDKRAKTAEELDTEKVNYVNNTDKLQFLVSFDMENRVRALERKPTITAAQYRAALKARL